MSNPTIWFITGSQHLYGDEALQTVALHAKEIAAALDKDASIAAEVTWKPTLTTPEQVTACLREANADSSCIGLVCWMHTFSPAKMWIAGLESLAKPFLHLHTQYNRDLPWESIDMDFMNLNQSAHGGREFGYICTRLNKRRKVVAGHWDNTEVRESIAVWVRAARAAADGRTLKIARIGDNMREVAVTEGDKVEAQRMFGWAVNGYGVGDLVEQVNAASDKAVDELVDLYRASYSMGPGTETEAGQLAVREAARIEAGLRTFIKEGQFGAFTTTFENLHGLSQLPGLAVQRLMAEGYGFGAEGDWKAAGLVRAAKVMAEGLQGGASFMEDYTYHFEPGNELVLGAHMLEICPSITSRQPSLVVHPLGIGGKADPARIVFDADEGPAVNACLVDLGDTFRMVLNTVDAVHPPRNLPNLPVARAFWKPRPSLKDAAEAWIYAGGSHHTAFSRALSPEHFLDYAEILGVETILID